MCSRIFAAKRFEINGSLRKRAMTALKRQKQLKEEELAIRKREIEVTATRQDDAIRQQQAMFTGLNAKTNAKTATEPASSACTVKWQGRRLKMDGAKFTSTVESGYKPWAYTIS
ncbi:hypothetical protein P5673_029796 [Acropora cervicornis]|uniref:Uncharacterized protein n=1 Tax=Acropora cervicornis TaxID=6130 RepID=A0AAD9PV60_ACRCE|nr:hypothetical protein P5673_029796 [Acropora cervicornis]